MEKEKVETSPLPGQSSPLPSSSMAPAALLAIAAIALQPLAPARSPFVPARVVRPRTPVPWLKKQAKPRRLSDEEVQRVLKRVRELE